LILLFACYSILVAGCGSSRKASHKNSYDQDIPEGRFHAVASWYGAEFHGRPTASGEIFNMYANTCAHKTYPFGTRVKISTASGSRTVECTVNDRGPFVEGRDIDLSFAAAREIGLTGSGTSRVFLETQGRDTSYIRSVKVQSTDKRGPFAIQVGSFTESINAVRLRLALRLKYANAYIQETEIRGTIWHRVRVGNFEQFSKAMDAAEQLGQEGYPALVLRADVQM
jgi:rare lipoprotein A